MPFHSPTPAGGGFGITPEEVVEQSMQARIDAARTRVDVLRAKDAKTRSALIQAIDTGEAEWEEYFSEVDKGLALLAADLQSADAEIRADVKGDADELAERAEASLDVADERLLRLDAALEAKERAVLDALSRRRDDLRRSLDELGKEIA